MATDLTFIRNLFGGGWATDFGPSFDGGPDQVNQLQVPFLVNAENVLYEFDGGPHKMPGTAKLNSAAMESGAVIKGIFDFWDTGTGSSSTQHRVVHVGTTIKKDDADGMTLEARTGEFGEGDGDLVQYMGNIGLPLGDDGFLNITTIHKR